MRGGASISQCPEIPGERKYARGPHCSRGRGKSRPVQSLLYYQHISSSKYDPKTRWIAPAGFPVEMNPFEKKLLNNLNMILSNGRQMFLKTDPWSLYHRPKRKREKAAKNRTGLDNWGPYRYI